MSNKGRPLRVAEEVRKEVGALLAKGLKDPRIGFVSIMAVRMSPDLRYANIYVSLMGTDQEKKASLVGLQRASGWVRRELGKRLRLRLTPEVRFFQDTSLDEVFELEEVFRALHDDEEEHAGPEE